MGYACVKVGEGLWSFAGSEMVGIKRQVCLLTSVVEGEFREWDRNTVRITGGSYPNPLLVGFH